MKCSTKGEEENYRNPSTTYVTDAFTLDARVNFMHSSCSASRKAEW